MLSPRLDQSRDPELDRLLLRGPCSFLQLVQSLVEKDAYRFARRTACKGVVDGLLPELEAQGANRRVRDELGEPDQLEVQRAQGGVGISNGPRDESTDEVRIIVAFATRCKPSGTVVNDAAVRLLKLRKTIFPRRLDICVRHVATTTVGRAVEEPFQAIARQRWPIHTEMVLLCVVRLSKGPESLQIVMSAAWCLSWSSQYQIFGRMLA